MYYMLLTDPAERYGIVADPPMPDGVSFLSGAVISQPLASPLTFRVDTTSKTPPPDYTRFKAPVMSKRLLEKLSALGIDNLQTFPARLENPQTGEAWDGYHAVNVVGLVSCLAVAESKATPGLPPLYDFDLSDLTVDDARSGGALMFRLAESPSVILIDERLGDEILGATPKFRGLEFRTVEAA
jgi:hypothetical protein